jgi:murein DD-endopeptidase MepM/ murein hydrolase activator NlpD
MRAWSGGAVLVSLSIVASGCAAPSAPHPGRALGDVHLVPDVEIVEARVPPRATLAGLLRAHRISDAVAFAIIERVREVIDLRRLRADQPYRLVRTVDGWLQRFEYEIDKDRLLRVSLPERVAPRGAVSPEAPLRLDVEIVAAEKARGLVAIRGQIDAEHPSLVEAIGATGEGIALAIDLAAIFAGEIDFNHDLHPGDRFEILFEKQIRDDTFVGYGPIVAANFTNGGRRVQAFRYEVPGKGVGYYDEQGRSLKRLLLSSPLPFEPRITSRFARRRLHPILGDYRAHLGVDYAAPPGTPVVAVAGGVVVAAGWAGGSGRMVHLRHGSGYESFYLHLSSIAAGIRPGVRVTQGQLIGRVGATGLATGPHLDFRLRRHGVFVNPLLERRRMPPGEPIPAAFRAAFEVARDRARAQLAGFDALASGGGPGSATP